MTRLDTLLLALLSAIGWGCGFALIGLMAFKGSPAKDQAAWVFAAFGGAAGVALLVLKLAMLRQLPRSLMGSSQTDTATSATPNHAAGHGAGVLGA